MARTESRIKTAVWRDAEFTALTARAQRAYFMMLSQPTISLCGVLAYTPPRWCQFASDETPDTVEAALEELEAERFVVVDRDTAEVWIRTFIRHDGVARSPKTLAAARGQAAGILSDRIRDGVEGEFALLDTPSDGLGDTESDGQAGTEPDTPRARGRADSDTDSYSDTAAAEPVNNQDRARRRQKVIEIYIAQAVKGRTITTAYRAGIERNFLSAHGERLERLLDVSDPQLRPERIVDLLEGTRGSA